MVASNAIFPVEMAVPDSGAGAPLLVDRLSNITVQVAGSFSGTFNLETTVDGEAWVVHTTGIAAGYVAVEENVRFIRLVRTGAGTNPVVTLGGRARARGSLAVPQVLRIRLPAISELNGIEAVYQGLGFTAHGCWATIPIADGFYLWGTLNGRGVDPGPTTPALAGMTGIRFDLAAGNHDREAVMAEVEAALIAALPGDVEVVNGGEYVDVIAVELDAASAQSGSPIGTGVSGMRGWRHPFASSGAAATTQRAQRINTARFPRRGRVIGWGCYLTAHTAGNQVHVGLSRGTGVTPDDSVMVADLGRTTGSSTGVQTVWLAPEDVYVFDLGDAGGPDLYVNYKTDASVSLGFASSQDEAVGGITYGLNNDYLDANGNPASATTAAGIWILGDTPPSGSASAFEDWTSIGSSVNFYSAVWLIVQSDVDADGAGSNVVGYYGDFQWEVQVGITAPTVDPAVWTGTAQAEVRVGWSYTWPAVEDAELDQLSIGYGTQANAGAEDQFRLEVGLGGTSNTNWTNATSLYSEVTAGATGTNVWRDIDIPEDEHYALPNAGGRVWLLIHRGAAGTSTIRFVGGGVETNAMVRTPHRYYNGQASEYEDPTALSSATPMSSPWTPVGSPTNPGNTGVLRWRARVRKTDLLEVVAA
jgi:hypothetical protein